jgi:plasmid rolling circle replication initiator protein Rep
MKKYTKKKRKNQVLARFIKNHVSKDVHEGISKCFDWAVCKGNEDMSMEKVHFADSCKNRFCPVCAKRKADKDAIQISVCMMYIEQIHKKEFVTMRFDAPSVPADVLCEEIDKYNKGWYRLFKYKSVSDVNQGYIRKLEITYDNEPNITHDMYYGNMEKHIYPRKDYYDARDLDIGDPNPNFKMFHPHFHVIMAVDKRYFKDKTYLKQEKWLNLWRKAMDMPQITQFFVKKLRSNISEKMNDQKVGKAVLEIAKYSAKDSDYLINPEVFEAFYNALKGRQLITYAGLFKDSVAKYKAGELDSYLEKDKTEYVMYLHYLWFEGKYDLEEFRRATPEEYTSFNKYSELPEYKVLSRDEKKSMPKSFLLPAMDRFEQTEI